MIIKPTRTIDNKERLLEIADLLVSLREELYTRHKIEFYAEEHLSWALDQAIMRLGLKDEVDYGTLEM